MEDENSAYSQEEINDMMFIKAYWKRQKQDRASRPLQSREKKKTNSRQQSLFDFVEKAKARSSKDEARKKLPSSHRSNPKPFKKSSHRSLEYFQRRKRSPPTGRSCQPFPKCRALSSCSSSSDSHESSYFHYPKHFNLCLMLPKKYPLQQKTDCYKHNKKYKSQARERWSTHEMEVAHKSSKRKPRSQRSSSHCCSRHSCCCRTYDSYSSSENESYHSSNRQCRRSRHSSRRFHRRRSSRSPYPHRKKYTKHCHKSKRSSSYTPIDMVNEPHSSKNQSPVHLFDHYNGASHSGRGCDLKRESNFAQIYGYHHKGNKRCRSLSFEQWSWSLAEDDVHEKHFEEDIAREIIWPNSKISTSSRPIDMVKEPHFSKRKPAVQRDSFGPYNQRSQSDGWDNLRREAHSAQNYTSHKRYRSPWYSWNRYPAKDVQENHYEEDLAREIKRQKTGSAKKHKIAVNEIWRSPTIDRGSMSIRHSSKKGSPRESFKYKASKSKLQKINCAVDKDNNKRLCEEFIRTMKMRKDIEKWIMSNGEGNSSTRSPKVVRKASSVDVAIENDLTLKTESQEVTFKEKVLLAKDPIKITESHEDDLMQGVMIVKDPAIDTESLEVTSPESADSIEKELNRETDVAIEASTTDEAASTESTNSIEIEHIRETDSSEAALTESTNSIEKESDSGKVTSPEGTNSIEKELIREIEPGEVTLIKTAEIEESTITDTESEELILIETAGVEADQVRDTESAETTLLETALIVEDPVRETESEEVTFIETVRIEKESARDFESAEATLIEVISTEKYLVNDTESKKIKPVYNVALQKDFKESKKIMPSIFFCNLCQLQLNSEVTWNTHIIGKRHTRKMQVQTVYEIAKGTLPVLAAPLIIMDDAPRFTNPPLGKRRRLTRDKAHLQSTIDEIRSEPVAGLEYVHEIISPMDVDYYCTLCDAPCKAASIVPHLIGFKHQLRVVKEIFPGFYDLNVDRQDKDFSKEIRRMLLKYEMKRGRGSIKVFREDDDPNTRSAYNQSEQSYRNPTLPYIKKEPNDDGKEKSPKDAFLDMSKGDFFCKLCDSHMNNQNMWEQHLRGRRHLENVKKVPGESISKIRSEKLCVVKSKLEQIIDEEASDELIVGLDYIRETRGPAGEMYNCFLCGSCSTNFDIIEHLLLLKHRTKYLEQLNVEGKSRVIEEIDNLLLRESSRDSLITYQCYKMAEDFGRGKVEVYKSKNSLTS